MCPSTPFVPPRSHNLILTWNILWERERERERDFIGLHGARGVGWVFHMKTERDLNSFGSLSQTPDRCTKMKPQRRVSGPLGPIIWTCSNRSKKKNPKNVLLTQSLPTEMRVHPLAPYNHGNEKHILAAPASCGCWYHEMVLKKVQYPEIQKSAHVNVYLGQPGILHQRWELMHNAVTSGIGRRVWSANPAISQALYTQRHLRLLTSKRAMANTTTSGSMVMFYISLCVGQRFRNNGITYR